MTHGWVPDFVHARFRKAIWCCPQASPDVELRADGTVRLLESLEGERDGVCDRDAGVYALYKPPGMTTTHSEWEDPALNKWLREICTAAITFTLLQDMHIYVDIRISLHVHC